jgi:hypothetical protein
VEKELSEAYDYNQKKAIHEQTLRLNEYLKSGVVKPIAEFKKLFPALEENDIRILSKVAAEEKETAEKKVEKEKEK